VRIGGDEVVVTLFVAVLSYSRRIFVKAFLSERQDDWFEGTTCAFQHFGGVPRTLLNDNAKSLVQKVNHEAAPWFSPRGISVSAGTGASRRKTCRPFRARTKGKTEPGVKYAKRNALAGRQFASIAALEAQLAEWMQRANLRVHGTTHEVPADRFECDEMHALRALPANPMPVRERQSAARSPTTCSCVDTVRYSVPHA